MSKSSKIKKNDETSHKQVKSMCVSYISLLLHTPWISPFYFILLEYYWSIKRKIIIFNCRFIQQRKRRKMLKLWYVKNLLLCFCCCIIFPYLVKPGAGILCWRTSPWKAKNQFIWKNLNFQKIILDFNSNKLKSINVLNIYALYNTFKGWRHLKVTVC